MNDRNLRNEFKLSGRLSWIYCYAIAIFVGIICISSSAHAEMFNGDKMLLGLFVMLMFIIVSGSCLAILRVFKQKSTIFGKIVTIYACLSCILLYIFRFCNFEDILYWWIFTFLGVLLTLINFILLTLYVIVRFFAYRPTPETTFLNCTPSFYEIIIARWFLIAAAGAMYIPASF